MRINFYDTRLEDCRTVLVKEKAVNYKSDGDVNICAPVYAVEMMNSIASLNVMAEEHCYMLALNNKTKLLGVFFISKGCVSQTLVNPREVFLRALLVGASQIVLCHNHPSGDAKPSRMDITLTQKFKEAGELLGLPVVDHIIIGENDYFSFMDKGLL